MDRRLSKFGETELSTCVPALTGIRRSLGHVRKACCRISRLIRTGIPSKQYIAPTRLAPQALLL